MLQNCDNICLDPTTDKCVQYTGPDIDLLGVKNGMFYDKLLVQLLDQLTVLLDANIELKCIYDGTCDKCNPVVNIPDAVQILIDKICDFDAKDVKYNGPIYCLGSGSTSGEGYKLMGKAFDYGVSTNPTGSSLFYDLNEAVSDLPDDYAIGSTRVTVSGRPKRGKTIISNSDKMVGAVPIENDRYPLNMKIDLNILTPNGTVSLSKNMSVPSPIAKSYKGILDVRDFTNPDNSSLKQHDFNDMLASEVCSLSAFQNILKSFEIASSDSFNAGGPGIQSAVGALAGAIQGLYDKIESLEKQMETCCECCNNCGCGDKE